MLEAIAARFDQLLDTTRHELMVLNRPPYVADPNQSESAVRRLLGADVTVRGIYAPEDLELPGALEDLEEAARAGEQARVHADLPMKLAIGDGELAILPIDVDTVNAAVCARPSALLNALVQLFELLWAQATPIVAPAHEGQFNDRQLAALLASGRRTTWSPVGRQDPRVAGAEHVEVRLRSEQRGEVERELEHGAGRVPHFRP